MSNFQFDLVTPFARVLSDEVTEVVAPGAEGEFGVLEGHSFLISVLKPGVVISKGGEGDTYIAVGHGYAEVNPDKTTVLVDSAEMAADINLDEAKTRLGTAEEALGAITDEDSPEYKDALIEFEVAGARVAAVERAAG